MKCCVICQVPTLYQLSSISQLMGHYEKLPSGRIYSRIDFETKGQARQWMKERNQYLYDVGAIGETRLRDNKRYIKSLGIIEYDAATAKIYDLRDIEMNF